MRVAFNPELVNQPFGDPGLLVDFNFEHRALLFDLGELGALAPKKLLRVSDVFVSHTHMDHFAGFDHLVRLCLGRATSIRLYGPPGFAAQVEHKLAAYTWNLVDNYPGDFFVEAWEVAPDWQGLGVRMRCRGRFRPEPLAPVRFEDGVLRDEPTFRVRAAVLDHGIACLGFAIEEKAHVNVWKNRLAELGLAVGPWLKTLKDAVLRGGRIAAVHRMHLPGRGRRAGGAQAAPDGAPGRRNRAQRRDAARDPVPLLAAYADREAQLRAEVASAFGLSAPVP
jgi:ribonuclease Z